jgi:hypothetical protein
MGGRRESWSKKTVRGQGDPQGPTPAATNRDVVVRRESILRRRGRFASLIFPD